MKQKPDFQYIAEILDDYCEIHSEGLVDEPLEYSEDSVREQIGLLKGFSADLEQSEEDATRYVREDIYLALQAQVEALRQGVFHFNRTHGDLNPLLKAVSATPAQCLSARDTEIKAQAVINFADMIRGAYLSGFVPSDLNVYDVYQSARNHVKDNYKINIPAWDDEVANQLRQQANEGE